MVKLHHIPRGIINPGISIIIYIIMVSYVIITRQQLFILVRRISYWWQRLDLCEHSSVVALRGGPNTLDLN